jgi:hypothetical protein
MDENVTRIRSALELLRVPRPKQRKPHSWIKKNYATEAGGMCIMGALEYLGAYLCATTADTKAILQTIKEQYPNQEFTHIPMFNDAKGRTFDEVERVLEKAAILREEEGAITNWSLT